MRNYIQKQQRTKTTYYWHDDINELIKVERGPRTRVYAWVGPTGYTSHGWLEFDIRFFPGSRYRKLTGEEAFLKLL